MASPPTALEEIAREVGSAVDSAADHLEAAAEVTGEMVGRGARKTVDLTRSAVDSGVAHVTRFGRMVLAAWKFFERLSNPPWTPFKTVTWAAIFLLVAVITVLAYQFKYGILTLPIIEEAGGRFIAWMAALGAVGLFLFTAVGTLFFMIIPTEPFFFVTLSGSTPVVLAIVAATLGSALGSCCNYGFGNRVRRSAGKETGEERKLGKWGKRAHSKWGNVLLFLSAALPMPEIIAFAYGVADYPFKKFVVITLVGRAVKWSWSAAAFLLFQFSMG